MLAQEARGISSGAPPPRPDKGASSVPAPAGPSLRREAFAVLLFALLALTQTGLWSDLGHRVYGGGHSDPGQDVFVLHWVTSHLFQPTIFEGNTFYPSHDSILFYDPLLLPAVLAWPVWMVSGNPVLSYNAALLLVLALASWGFYRLCLHLFEADEAASVFAGFVIPYTAQQTSNLWHINLLTLSGFPFLLLAMLKMFDRPTAAWAVVLGVSFAFQSATSGYYAFTCLFLCGFLAAWHWRRFRARAMWGYFGLAGVVAVAILLPYLRGFMYLRSEEASMVRSVGEEASYSIDLPRSLLVSHSYLWARFSWAHGSRPLFPGLTVSVLGVVGLAYWRSHAQVRLLAALGVVFLLIALGPVIQLCGHPVGPGPFTLLRALPLVGAVRHPITFAVPTMMALGLLGAGGLHRSGLSRFPLAFGAILLCAWTETLGPRPAATPASQDLPDVYRYVKSLPPGAFMELFSPAGEERDPWDGSQAQWWAIWHGMPVVQGAGAFEPDRYTDLWQKVRKEWKTVPAADMEGRNSIALLKADFPIRYLILHKGTPDPIVENVEATPSCFELLHRTHGGDRVYRVHRGGKAPVLGRLFRDDQLVVGRITTTLRRPSAGGIVSATFNGRPLDRRVLTAEWTDVTWSVPHSLVHRGTNELEVRAEGGPGEVVEMKDVESS